MNKFFYIICAISSSPPSPNNTFVFFTVRANRRITVSPRRWITDSVPHSRHQRDHEAEPTWPNFLFFSFRFFFNFYFGKKKKEHNNIKFWKKKINAWKEKNRKIPTSSSPYLYPPNKDVCTPSHFSKDCCLGGGERTIRKGRGARLLKQRIREEGRVSQKT